MKCDLLFCNEDAKRRVLVGELGKYKGTLCDRHYKFAKAFGIETRNGRKLMFLS